MVQRGVVLHKYNDDDDDDNDGGDDGNDADVNRKRKK